MQNVPQYELPARAVGQDAERAEAFDRDGCLFLPQLFNAEQIDAALDAFKRLRETNGQNRIQDGWRSSEALRELATDAHVVEILRQLYGREPIPFQTLNFVNGSEQRVHCDSMHFSSFPPRFMCAVWVALEDVDHGNGPLVYYPGSHRLPEYQLDDTVNESNVGTPQLEDYSRYPDFLEGQLKHRGIERKELHLKKGDALIWSSNLAHGGAPIREDGRSRLSHISHYYFENCVYYTPRLSHPYIGRFWLRRIDDVRTAKTVPHRYRDFSFSVPAPGLYAFAPHGKPRPVANRLGHYKAAARNAAKALLRR